MLRLRPILMTTGAMVLGACRWRWRTAPAPRRGRQIGWVIVGGMLLGTLLTLFVVPTAYTLLAGKRVRVTNGEEPAAPLPQPGAAD